MVREVDGLGKDVADRGAPRRRPAPTGPVAHLGAKDITKLSALCSAGGLYGLRASASVSLTRPGPTHNPSRTATHPIRPPHRR